MRWLFYYIISEKSTQSNHRIHNWLWREINEPIIDADKKSYRCFVKQNNHKLHIKRDVERWRDVYRDVLLEGVLFSLDNLEKQKTPRIIYFDLVSVAAKVVGNLNNLKRVCHRTIRKMKINRLGFKIVMRDPHRHQTDEIINVFFYYLDLYVLKISIYFKIFCDERH